jgi:hypothetical protein
MRSCIGLVTCTAPIVALGGVALAVALALGATSAVAEDEDLELDGNLTVGGKIDVAGDIRAFGTAAEVTIDGTLKVAGRGEVWIVEGDQPPPHGHWRIVADDDVLFVEVWESGELPFEVQDEFVHFDRKSHTIKWSYNMLGRGIRDLAIGANSEPTEEPRTLNFVVLDSVAKQLRSMIALVPDGAHPKVGIGTSDPESFLDVANPLGDPGLRLRNPMTPTGTADSVGNIGDVSWDDDYVYVKTSAGWKRTGLRAW